MHWCIDLVQLIHQMIRSISCQQDLTLRYPTSGPVYYIPDVLHSRSRSCERESAFDSNRYNCMIMLQSQLVVERVESWDVSYYRPSSSSCHWWSLRKLRHLNLYFVLQEDGPHPCEVRDHTPNPLFSIMQVGPVRCCGLGGYFGRITSRRQSGDDMMTSQVISAHIS